MEYQSNESVDSFIVEFLPLGDQLEALRREVEIFGDQDDLPPDEWALVFESNLPHEEMMAQLRILRAGKEVKAQSFARRMTPADRIHARGMGIQVD
jgi:hypothetical protein